MDATGAFSIDWRVNYAQFMGQAVRFGRSLTRWFGRLVIPIVAVALVGSLLRALADR